VKDKEIERGGKRDGTESRPDPRVVALFSALTLTLLPPHHFFFVSWFSPSLCHYVLPVLAPDLNPDDSITYLDSFSLFNGQLVSGAAHYYPPAAHKGKMLGGSHYCPSPNKASCLPGAIKL